MEPVAAPEHKAGMYNRHVVVPSSTPRFQDESSKTRLVWPLMECFQSSVGGGTQKWLLCVVNCFVGSSGVQLPSFGQLRRAGVDVKQPLLHRVACAGLVLVLYVHVAGE
eukprot:5507762-Amphidinium_carterae.3